LPPEGACERRFDSRAPGKPVHLLQRRFRGDERPGRISDRKLLSRRRLRTGVRVRLHAEARCASCRDKTHRPRRADKTRQEESRMKRFHVHVAVPELSESIRFYSTLFGAEPAVRKNDYA